MDCCPKLNNLVLDLDAMIRLWTKYSGSYSSLHHLCCSKWQ